MKANKAVKRLAKIEVLMSDVMERYSESAPHIREVLQDAKAAVTRAKEAVSWQASAGTAKNPPAQRAQRDSTLNSNSLASVVRRRAPWARSGVSLIGLPRSPNGARARRRAASPARSTTLALDQPGKSTDEEHAQER